jgi:hypothetical protein
VPSTYQARTGEGAAAGAAAPKAAAAPAVPGGLQPWGEDGTAADGGDGDAGGDDTTAAAPKKSFGRAKKRQLTVRCGQGVFASRHRLPACLWPPSAQLA